MNWKVYMHKSPSGKVYIGITGRDLKKRWLYGYGYKSNEAFSNAIKKYGWDNIEHRLLFDNLTEQEAKMIEVDLIYYYKKIGICYNITDGGEGTPGGHWKLSLETKKKMSKAKTGFKHSAEAKQKISDTKKGNKRTWRTNEKVVEQIDNDGTIVAVYDSVSNAAAALGINVKRLYTALYRGKPTAGFNWKYKDYE